MCIQFVVQALKQKNAHVSFPVGMVPYKHSVLTKLWFLRVQPFTGWTVFLTQEDALYAS